MTAASGRFEEPWGGLQDLALVVEDRDTAERLLRVVGALDALCELHAADERGRCRLCRRSRGFRRQAHHCTVQDVFTRQGLGPLTRAEARR
jgi:hypothetical protein